MRKGGRRRRRRRKEEEEEEEEEGRRRRRRRRRKEEEEEGGGVIERDSVCWSKKRLNNSLKGKTVVKKRNSSRDCSGRAAEGAGVSQHTHAKGN